MEEDKNIRLTIVRPEGESDSEIQLDLLVVFDNIKRLFTLWLACAVAVCGILGGIGILFRDMLSSTAVTAVVSYNSQSSLLKSGRPDMEKLISASVVSNALKSLGISLDELDTVRTNLSIEGVIPDSVMDERTMYYKIYSKASVNAMDAVEKLLSSETSSSRYLLKFDYKEAGVSREDGVKILNALIEAYRKYFMDTYTSRPLLGSMTNIIDFQEYDYAETAEVLGEQLRSIMNFLSAYTGSSFRSSVTGYTVEDMIRLARNIRDAELDRISAFIQLGGIYKGSLSEVVSRYEWRIEQTDEEIAVLEGRLASLNTAIQNYQKDPIIYVVNDSGATKGPGGELNGVYDDLISQLLATQSDISYRSNVKERYETLIERLSSEIDAVTPGDIARVEQNLESLNNKVSALVQLTNRTMDDYFSTTLSSLLSVQMPALAESPQTISRTLILMVAAGEGLVFAAYMGFAVGLALAQAKKEEKARGQAERPADG